MFCNEFAILCSAITLYIGSFMKFITIQEARDLVSINRNTKIDELSEHFDKISAKIRESAEGGYSMTVIGLELLEDDMRFVHQYLNDVGFKASYVPTSYGIHYNLSVFW